MPSSPGRGWRARSPPCSPTAPGYRRWARPRPRSRDPARRRQWPTKCSPRRARRRASHGPRPRVRSRTRADRDSRWRRRPARVRRHGAGAVTERPWTGRRLHFVGIGGAGMSGIALVGRALGADVTGSDRAESSYLRELREAGIQPAIGHDAANVPDGDDVELVYSTAVGPDNPERDRAGERGLIELHRADVLAEITALRPTIAITGTHGKTTTAAMTVHALIGAGADPGYLVGGEVRSTGTNAGWGAGEWLVVEADESDRSMLKLHPAVALVTNVELDHHATYASPDRKSVV